ncbi:hypothetical protein GCM10027277_16940 [Pseudoduganella ginsengisoli]|uniref:Serine hydrolase n=1 Tax=Pseudoduganella ginsengisoli TaxID=1462440 RepID=A0A6L6PVA7_9BURK|nr:serine hydrolase domain-containing protein [Pseudoduganella ginsengisoli]MTW01044.1 serine hydrolase [Pseudoduganella ginsengisoli]
MLRRVFLLSIVWWACGASAQSQSVEERIARVENGLLAPVAVRDAPPQTMRLEERMRELHVPGVSIAVINHGDIEWARAYGVMDVRTGRPVTTGTLFQAASISKPLAAVTTLRLAAQGKIHLDEDVNRRLRSWQLAAGQPVTPHALLSHTAGLPENGLPGYGSGEPQPSLLQVLRGAPPATTPPAAVQTPPGSQYGYSGLGYAVLQQYLMDATQKDFTTLARQQVLAPLRMHDTVFAPDLPAGLAQRAATGHELDGSPVAGNWRRYPELTAAGAWSTATDLARFAIAIQRAAQGKDTRLLTQQQAATLLTPVQNGYGLGFELDHAGKEQAFHHSGSNAGYKALLFAYTRTGQGAVILTNGDYGWPLIEELMRSIAAEYGWEDYRPLQRSAVAANPALHDRFIGDYSVSNITLRIHRDGERLYASAPPLGPAPVELIAAGDYDYFIREKDATVRFHPEGNGPVQTLTFTDGRERPGKRKTAGTGPAQADF